MVAVIQLNVSSIPKRSPENQLHESCVKCEYLDKVVGEF